MNNKIKNSKYYKEILNRVDNTREKGISNCIGSLEYFVQEKNNDEYSGCYEVENMLGKMISSPYPVIGGVVRWWKDLEGFTYHAGIIIETEPEILITHRKKCFGKVEKFEKLRDIEEKSNFNYNSINREYLIPSKLQKILDSEVLE